MLRTVIAAAVATVTLSTAPLAAATVADVYSSFWVFGDSLTDNGKVSAALAAAMPPVDFPPPPYFNRRFSNGPVWTERFPAGFGPGASGSFAFGGARSAENGDGIPDLPLQIGAFDTMVAGLRSTGLTIHTVDSFALLKTAAMNPAALGLTNLTDACLPVDPFRILESVPVPMPCTAPDTFLYWDQLDPTRVGHDALAAVFDSAVPAIPLPAPALLLLAGLGQLATRRRRAA